MKKVKSAVFDSFYVRDISLLLRQEVTAIPDNIFRASKDLQEAIRKGQVICDGSPHRGQLVKLTAPRSTVQEPDAPVQNNLSNRVSVLERSVGHLLKAHYQNVLDPKYDDYVVYTNAFLSTDYDAMVFDTFLDESKRDPGDPGSAVIENGVLTHSNTDFFEIYNSKTYQMNHKIERIFPMARWVGKGSVQMIVRIGTTEIVIVDSTRNDLWQDIGNFDEDTVNITIALHSKTSKISLKSYGLLMKLKTENV